MRVLVTADTIGGVWTYTRELVTYLSEHGHEVVLVSLGSKPSSAQTGWLRDLRRVEYFPTDFRLEWMRDSAEELEESSRYLLKLIALKRPDCLHLSQYCYGALATDVPKIVVAHSDVVSWWVAVHNDGPGSQPWIGEYREGIKRGIAGADMVVGVSRWMLRQIETHYARPKSVEVVYNCRSELMFDSSMPKKIQALSVGRLWDRAKQISLLTESAMPMPVMIAGEKAHPEGGVANCDAIDGVKWLGRQSEEQLRDLYAGSAIYVGTSRYEPFGLAPLEAALSGCVLLLNDIPTFREIWGDTALYFERNSAAALNAALQKLRDKADLRAEWSVRARQRALERYTRERMGARYIQLYGMLVGARELVG